MRGQGVESVWREGVNPKQAEAVCKRSPDTLSKCWKKFALERLLVSGLE
jgi:hypothetical protein